MVLYSDSQFWDALLIAGVAFLLNLPGTYNFTHGLLGRTIPMVNRAGCPTWQGVAIHSLVLLVFVVLIVRSLKKKIDEERTSVVVLNTENVK